MTPRASADIIFRSLIENGSDVIWMIHPSGTLQYNSPSTERVLGYDPDELLDRHFVDLLHEEDRDVARTFFAQQIASENARGNIDFRVAHKDGTYRWFSVVASNIVSDGAVAAVISNARDITDRRLLEAQLEQAHRLTSLGRLAATVAHEFNNVLMGIQPFVDLMQLPNVPPQTFEKGAAHIAASVARGKRVTLDILRFTRPAQPSLGVVDLHSWWERFSIEMQAMTHNHITFVSDFAPEPLPVVADPVQLSQVFSNLLANARDAMPDGGTLTIRARRPAAGQSFPFGIVARPETYAFITVEDSGIGMTEEVRRHVFDPLFTTKQRGTGLGLAVAHQVVTRHHGAIFVESEPGRGSAFHVFLPLAHEAQRATSDERAENAKAGCARVLIVDDEESVAAGLQVILRMQGVRAEIVTRGEEALPAAQRLRPDLAVVDMRLPDISGTEVGRRLRERWPDLKMLFVSGDGAADALPFQGAVGFLPKPFTLSALLDAMNALEEGRA